MPDPARYELNLKRRQLYFMDRLLVYFAQAVTNDRYMPDDPWPMTLNELSAHISDELGRMNDAGEW